MIPEDGKLVTNTCQSWTCNVHLYLWSAFSCCNKRVHQPQGNSSVSTIFWFQLFKASLDTYRCMLNPKAVHMGKVALMEVFHCALHISSACLHCAWHYCTPGPKVRFHICDTCLN